MFCSYFTMEDIELEGLIGFFISRITVNLKPKRRRREDILKGVKTDD